MQLKKLIKIAFYIGLSLLIFFFFHKKEKIIINKRDIEQFEHLDIIVSSGQSVQSKLLNLINLSAESYSHVGIICKESEKIFVLHSTPDGTKENSIRYDDLQTFIDLSNVNYYKLLRSKNQIESFFSIDIIIEKYKINKIPFDYDFDNINKERIYCSELVYDIFKNEGIIISTLNLDKPIYPKMFTELDEFKTVMIRKSTANKKYS